MIDGTPDAVKSHVRCEAGEKLEITSKAYLSLLLDIGFIPSGDFNVTAASRLLLINEIREFKPYWIEEAVYPDDYEGYKMLVESTDVRIDQAERMKQQDMD